jgi:glycosyltransferase involved in cell wall biosynthesis
MNLMNNEMKIDNADYLVCIKVEKTSGKELASYYKSLALSEIIPKYRLFCINKKRGQLFNLFNYFFFEIKYTLRVILEKKKPKIIISRCYFNFAPIIIKKLYGSRIFSEVHSDPIGELIHLPISKVKKNMLGLILKLSVNYLKYFDGLIFNNPILENKFKIKYKLNSISSTSVYNGAPKYLPRKTISNQRILNKHNLPNDKIFIVFAGSISKWHGLENLIDIFPYLQKLNPKIELLIIGESKDKKYFHFLKERKSNRANFLGRLNPDEVFNIFQISHLGVVPVNSNRMSPGSPIKLYDMIRSDLPVVTQKNTSGYSDVVIENNLGIVIDFNDHILSAKEISKLINKIEKKELIFKNAQIAKNQLSWNQVIIKWFNFIENNN